MKLAITGGSGFLACHVCNRLFDKYEEIYLLDIAPINPQEYPSNAKYFNADVRDPSRLCEIFRKVDVVIHAAAALPLWKKKDIFDINVGGTKNVLEAAKENSVEKVIYVSSTAVYGVPKKHPIYEDDPLMGVGHYGKSKIEAEKICEDRRKSGMRITVVRPKSFVGTGRLGVFQILYDWIESGKKIPIIGDGGNRYQLLEVEDLVSAIDLFIDSTHEKTNDVFNVGAEKFDTVREDVGALCEFAKTGARPMPVPAWIAVPLLSVFEKCRLSPIYAWVYQTAGTDSFVSIEKIKTALGWSPKYSNAQALIRSYKWYLEHKDEISETGVTHRVAWKQGILKLLKKFS